MSDYLSSPPVPPSPDEQRMERGCRRWVWGIGLLLGAVALASVYAIIMAVWMAFGPAGREEHAKDWVGPPRPTPRRPSVQVPAPPPAAPSTPAVSPPAAHAPAEVPMAAQGGARREQEPRVPAFTVGGTEFTEPEARVATQIDGKETITLHHLWLPGKEITVPVTELSLVSRNAKQTAIGVCAGKRAERQGNLRTRNKVFLRRWRVACAAFTGFCCRPCGRPGMSFVAHTQYTQLRKRGAKLVASKVSTRYAPFYPYFKRGDYLFFWKSGSRIGHVEVSMGGGWTVGTSSSAGYVARRRTGNRGFSRMSVVRL